MQSLAYDPYPNLTTFLGGVQAGKYTEELHVLRFEISIAEFGSDERREQKMLAAIAEVGKIASQACNKPFWFYQKRRLSITSFIHTIDIYIVFEETLDAIAFKFESPEQKNFSL